GTTGESPVLSGDERFTLYREALRASAGRARIIAGTGGNNTQESVHLSRRAAEIGVHGLLQVTPYYNKPPQDGLVQHFKTIAAATPLPNILYNVPARTSLNMAAATVARLSEIDNIIGVKEASGDMDQIAEIVRTAKAAFQVYSGNDSDTFLVLALGGVGVISVASHVVSGEIREMIDAFVEGDIERARRLHLHLLPIARGLFPPGWANPIAVKAALALAGFDAGKPRLPLLELPAEHRQKLQVILQAYKLDPFLHALPVSA
ncbi:MAG: 4-hydroxy-tetrahydrodipicolinate synthase, partial [Actinobacteria bacterium]|nr:4-hydroxy-tetrahydrodipicolinate synthase [Actinomycetota bacterium]